MPLLKTLIIQELQKTPGVRAKVIAKRLGVPKQEVSRILHEGKDTEFKQDDNWQWTYIGVNPVATPIKTTTTTNAINILFDKVVNEFQLNPKGIMAKTVAKNIGATKKEVNQILHSGKGVDFSQNRLFYWTYICKPQPQQKTLDYHSIVVTDGKPLPKTGLTTVVVEVFNREGATEKFTCSMFKDPNGDLYHVEKNRFDSIKSKGVPLAQFYDLTHDGSKPTISYFANLPMKSVIGACGYSTAACDELSDKQRECILENVIRNGLKSPSEVISHIEWCIRTHQQDMFRVNRKKWADDIAFVKNMF